MPALKKYSVCFPNAFNIAKVDKFKYTLEGVCMHMNAYTSLGFMDFTIRVCIEYVSLIPVYLICAPSCLSTKIDIHTTNLFTLRIEQQCLWPLPPYTAEVIRNLRITRIHMEALEGEVKECRQRKTNNNSNNNNNFMRSFNLKARLWLDDNIARKEPNVF
uniref:Uncharacterized protein n=1 Tax=Glossina pallidipes TaxID=7398 RepID=A0A1A9Z2H7_GLOPL